MTRRPSFGEPFLSACWCTERGRVRLTRAPMQMNATEKLLNRTECIREIFSARAGPCPRTWETWKARRIVPFVRIGRKTFYDPERVREALIRKFTVMALDEGRGR